MKINRPFFVVILAVVLLTLSACDASNNGSATASGEEEKNSKSENIGESNDSLHVDTETKENNGNEEVEQDTSESEIPSPEPNEEEEPPITSGEEAAQYLKQHLEEGKDEDISFGADGKLETDQNGSYYTVQVVDISLRVAGKTGNLGYYKVYEDGTYELYSMISNDSETVINSKEEYLKKLHDIEKEIEEARKNSEATTTLDMEKEEAHYYEMWDVELNEIYGILKEQLSTEEMDQLRVEQRNWIVYRDETAEESSLKYEGGTLQSVEYVATQANLTRERCYELVENYLK